MSDHAHSGKSQDSADALRPEECPESEGIESIEAYDTDDGVVFYDAENPLAWLKATNAVGLKELI